MGMNLDNMQNVHSDDLNLTEQRFGVLKNYMKAAEKDPEPAHDADLNFSIDAMLNRWKVSAGNKRDELKILVAKMHAKRIKDHESRIIYRLLNANLDNISVAISP